MKQTLDIDEVTRRIVETAHPHRIILYGSRGRGMARSDSDWDILVIADSNLPRHRRAAQLYGVLRDMPADVDILVYTPDELSEWGEVPQAFVTTAAREGKVLYEDA
jgi:predicted nucleotidyltransferase